MTFYCPSNLPTVAETYDFISPARFAGKLKGKVALITGASSGIGKEACFAFAAAGASVACVARRKDRLDALVSEIKQKYGVEALAVAADVAEPGNPKQIIEEVQHSLGPVDILINNAGITRMSELVTEDDFERYWKVVEVNVRGPMALTHAVLPSMVERKTGVIINVSSRAAQLDVPWINAYGTSKAALTKFTQGLAAETADHGILSFSLHPGTVHTELAQADGNLHPNVTNDPRFPGFMAKFMAMTFQPAEVMANTCVALCADERWKVMNGRHIDAEQPLDVILKEAEKPGMGVIGEKALYRLKLDLM